MASDGDVPFEQVVDDLRPHRDPSHTPIVQVMFAFQNVPLSVPQFTPDLQATAMPVEGGGAKFDITLYLDDYKLVDGVMLPHHMARSIDGKPTEEMTFKTIRVNPSFKADTFTTK